MICYIVTEDLHFTHPDYKHLNPKLKNIVSHICDDEKEAWEYIDTVVKFPLYKPFNGKFRKEENRFSAKIRGIGSCVFEVHKHIF